MCLAVVAEVEPEDREAVLVKKLGGTQNIRRVDTALPAVQKHDQPFGIRLCRVEALQTHLPHRVEDDLFRVRENGIVPLRAEFVAGKEGLSVGAADVERRVKGVTHTGWIVSALEEDCQLD